MKKPSVRTPKGFDYRQALGRVTYVMGREWTLKAMKSAGADTMQDLRDAIEKEPPRAWHNRIFEAWHYVVHVRPERLIQNAIDNPGTALNVEDLVAARVYAADVEDLMERPEGARLREAVSLGIPIKGRLIMYRGA